MRNARQSKTSSKKLISLSKYIRPKRLGLLLGIFFLSSCAGLSRQPDITLCVHDQPRMAVYCNNNQTGEDSTLNIEDTNKYIMLSPDDWGTILRYLRRGVKYKVFRKEIRKVLKSNDKIMLWKENFSATSLQ